MKNIRITIFLVIAYFGVSLINSSCVKREKMKALIVTGQNNHRWQSSSFRLKTIIENSGIFSVDVKISPEQDQNMSEFLIDFSPYDVVVLDYNGAAWPSETKGNFTSFVKNGGGVVVYHAADNSFPDWPEYNEIIGLGGWEGRDDKSGPYVYIKDGVVVRDDSPGTGGAHGEQHEFVVETYKPEHPILKGLPAKWLHKKDELYSQLRGPAKNMEILAFAYDDKKFNGFGRNEPILMTVTYGKGRVFHTVMGHAGDEIYPPSMECAGFITTLQRGAEWAATGRVTQKVPENFPSETESLAWEFYQDIHGDIKSFVEQMQNYKIGKSNVSFNILKKLITENKDDQEKMEQYHKIVLGLLKSGKTTDDCKKILCKEFSWMANDSYRKIYEKLKQEPLLADEAQYALDIINKK